MARLRRGGIRTGNMQPRPANPEPLRAPGGGSIKSMRRLRFARRAELLLALADDFFVVVVAARDPRRFGDLELLIDRRLERARIAVPAEVVPVDEEARSRVDGPLGE